MKESDVWQTFKKGMSPYCLLTRIESSAGNGVPDVAGTMNNKHFWVELKHVHSWPVRDTTKVKLDLRPEQKLWISTRGKLGKSVWVFIRIENDFFLVNWDEIELACEGWTQEEWSNVFSWKKGKIDFEHICRIIKRDQ